MITYRPPELSPRHWEVGNWLWPIPGLAETIVTVPSRTFPLHYQVLERIEVDLEFGYGTIVVDLPFTYGSAIVPYVVEFMSSYRVLGRRQHFFPMDYQVQVRTMREMDIGYGAIATMPFIDADYATQGVPA